MKSGIGKKLLLSLLGLGLAVLLLITAGNLWLMNRIKTNLDNRLHVQAEELKALNTGLMAESNADMLTAIAGNYSDVIESRFAAIALQVKTAGNYLETAYTYEISGASVFPDDMVYLQPGTTMDAVESEFEIVKSVRDVIAALMAADPAVSVYYVSESGMLLADRYADYTDGSQIDRRTRPWYTKAVESGEVFWTPIYVDALSGEMTITCSAPVYSPDGRVKGVVASDILLNPLIDEILASDTEVFEYIFLLDEEGKPFVGSDPDKTLSDFITPEHYDEVIASMQKADGKSGLFEGEEFMVGYATVPVTGWQIGVVMDYGQITAPKRAIAASIGVFNQAFHEYLNENILLSVVISIAVAFLAVVLVIAVSRRVAGSITRPLAELTATAAEISSGNLEQSIDIRTDDELAVLAGAFNKMTASLKTYMNNLTAVTAERTRITTELNLAARIQSGMLPGKFPAFPERSNIDIYATMIPAKEVGGDFYDFFLIDEDNLGLVIADVSGKGIPAALFMVISKTLLGYAARQGKSPKEMLEAVNAGLAQNNEENMFVTVFAGILHLPSGKLRYSSAGHNPPYILTGDGRAVQLAVTPMLMLAAYENTVYDQREVTLRHGDSLVLYTDGVTEAMTAEGKLFGETRLEAALVKADHTSARGVLDAVYQEVKIFENGADPADDLTIMVILRPGNAGAALSI